MVYLRLWAILAAVIVLGLVAIGFITQNRNYFRYAWRAFWAAVGLAVVFVAFFWLSS
jgi:hypothetical protein